MREVVPRAWTIFFAEMVEKPELARDLNDRSDVAPAKEAQVRVWAALTQDLARLGEVHEMEF